MAIRVEEEDTESPMQHTYNNVSTNFKMHHTRSTYQLLNKQSINLSYKFRGKERKNVGLKYTASNIYLSRPNEKWSPFWSSNGKP